MRSLNSSYPKHNGSGWPFWSYGHSLLASCIAEILSPRFEVSLPPPTIWASTGSSRPENLDYDQASRRYRPADSFKPIFELHAERVLAWLSKNFGDGLDLGLKQATPCEGAPGQLVRPDMDILAAIHAGLVRQAADQDQLPISYLWAKAPGDRSSGASRQRPALACPRLRPRAATFGDFVLTRIAKASPMDGEAEERELLGADEQWARIVDLELVPPHPGIEWPKAVEADYAMSDGALRIKTRAALAGYVLRRWSIDSTPDHSLDPASHHLWLRNTPTLYGVEKSAALAPGAALSLEKAPA